MSARAAGQRTVVQKTIDTVRKYVLPKFKTEVKADKTFYLPKETIVADIQSGLISSASRSP